MLEFIDRTKNPDKLRENLKETKVRFNKLYPAFQNFLTIHSDHSWTKKFEIGNQKDTYEGISTPYQSIDGVVRYVNVGTPRQSKIMEKINKIVGAIQPIIVEITGYTHWPKNPPDHREIYHLYPNQPIIEVLDDGAAFELDMTRCAYELQLLEEIAATVENPFDVEKVLKGEGISCG